MPRPQAVPRSPAVPRPQAVPRSQAVPRPQAVPRSRAVPHSWAVPHSRATLFLSSLITRLHMWFVHEANAILVLFCWYFGLISTFLL